MILAIFDLQVTQMLPTKFQVNWPLVQEKKGKIDFQDGCHGSHPDASHQVTSQLAFSFRSRSKKYFFKMAAIWDF